MGARRSPVSLRTAPPNTRNGPLCRPPARACRSQTLAFPLSDSSEVLWSRTVLSGATHALAALSGRNFTRPSVVYGMYFAALAVAGLLVGSVVSLLRRTMAEVATPPVAFKVTAQPLTRDAHTSCTAFPCRH